MNPTLTQAFSERFHAPAAFLVRAPGRVNLIGEHTDYNLGYVLPMAIERSMQIALRPRSDQRVCVHSLEYNTTLEFDLSQDQPGKGWLEYLRGAAWALRREGWQLCGWDGVMTGDVPRGAGLSSSSALTVAAVLSFAALVPPLAQALQADPAHAALLAHYAEDEWVGVHGGIMDQTVSMLARSGHALFLDCRSLATRQIPLPSRMAVVVLDTATRRGLVDSDYNQRRAQCESAARSLGVPSLRDASPELLASCQTRMDPVPFRRARHVIHENARVLAAVQAMEQDNAAELGRLLDASHASLREDFEVSSPELDAIVRIARAQPACQGARMTGAGFGGCALAWIEKEQGSAFIKSVLQAYKHETSLEGAAYLCQGAEGARILPLTS